MAKPVPFTPEAAEYFMRGSMEHDEVFLRATILQTGEGLDPDKREPELDDMLGTFKLKPGTPMDLVRESPASMQGLMAESFDNPRANAFTRTVFLTDKSSEEVTEETTMMPRMQRRMQEALRLIAPEAYHRVRVPGAEMPSLIDLKRIIQVPPHLRPLPLLIDQPLRLPNVFGHFLFVEQVPNFPGE